NHKGEHMKANLKQTTLKAGQLAMRSHRLGLLFTVVLAAVASVVVTVAPSKASAAPTAQQYALVQSAVDAQIAQSSARVAAARALMHGPFFLRTVGAAQLALAMSEFSRFTSLKKQTTDAQSAGANPPQAAIDLAMKQAAARMSIAVASRNYGLLGLYAAQVAQISSLNQAIQQGNAYVAATPRPRSGVRFTSGPASTVNIAPVRRPASDQGECEQRNGRMVCFRTSVTVR
ncbi:MAG: hypothetical protein U1E10_05070, partial [Bdellovibrionales bacterium]|nr:hypothetical protein [Bdellovibrionales bacterium]